VNVYGFDPEIVKVVGRHPTGPGAPPNE